MRYPTAPTISTAPAANFAPAFMPNYTCPSRACSSAHRTRPPPPAGRGPGPPPPPFPPPRRCASCRRSRRGGASPAARPGPMERCLDRPPPLRLPRARPRRPVAREEAPELPAGEELLRRAPHAHAQPGEGGGAERRRLDDVRPHHRHPQEVRLELHQPVVRGRAAVDLQGMELKLRISRHRLEHVLGAEGHRLERRAGEVSPRRAAGD